MVILPVLQALKQMIVQIIQPVPLDQAVAEAVYYLLYMKKYAILQIQEFLQAEITGYLEEAEVVVPYLIIREETAAKAETVL